MSAHTNLAIVADLSLSVTVHGATEALISLSISRSLTRSDLFPHFRSLDPSPKIPDMIFFPIFDLSDLIFFLIFDLSLDPSPKIPDTNRSTRPTQPKNPNLNRSIPAGFPIFHHCHGLEFLLPDWHGSGSRTGGNPPELIRAQP